MSRHSERAARGDDDSASDDDSGRLLLEVPAPASADLGSRCSSSLARPLPSAATGWGASVGASADSPSARAVMLDVVLNDLVAKAIVVAATPVPAPVPVPVPVPAPVPVPVPVPALADCGEERMAESCSSAVFFSIVLPPIGGRSSLLAGCSVSSAIWASAALTAWSAQSFIRS